MDFVDLHRGILDVFVRVAFVGIVTGCGHETLSLSATRTTVGESAEGGPVREPSTDRSSGRSSVDVADGARPASERPVDAVVAERLALGRVDDVDIDVEHRIA